MADSLPQYGGEGIKLALPSDGDLYEPSLAFLRSCGIAVDRPSARRYTARIPALPGVAVLFQRTADITQKVEEGSAELGITGVDRLMEFRHEASPVLALIDRLGFGHCELVLAVPDSWIDVVSLDDVADLALEFRNAGRQLRIATKYPRLLSKYLFSRGINYFSAVQASGSLEAAPLGWLRRSHCRPYRQRRYPARESSQDHRGWHYTGVPGLPDRESSGPWKGV